MDDQQIYQPPQQDAGNPGDPIEKLYSVVKSKGLYGKSLDEFKAKYSTPESIGFLYDVVSGKRPDIIKEPLYGKSKDDFQKQYFSSTVSAQPKSVTPPSDVDVTNIKNFLTGTTQQQRTQEHNQQAAQVLPKQKGLTQVQPAQPLTEKQVSDHAKEKLNDPLLRVWLQNAEDPIGQIRRESAQANQMGIPPQNPSEVIAQQNQQRVNEHIADVMKEGYFEGGHDAANYLKKRGIDVDKPEAIQRPLNETEQEAVKKVQGAKQVNDLLDKYPLTEAAMRKESPDLSGMTPEQYKRENNALAGQAFAKMISDPDVQERAKYDSRLRLQLLRAQHTLVQDFPDYAAPQIASKISQKLEDAHGTNWLANNPTKEQADWAANELEKEGKLSPNERKLYEKDIVPKIEKATSWTNALAMGVPIANAFADENPIKSRGVFENAVESFRNQLKGGARTAEEATVAPAVSLFSKNGLADFQNKIANERAGATHFEPTGFGKVSTTMGNIIGMIAPTVLGAKGLQGLGASENVSNALSFALPFAGGHLADSRELFKGDPAKQTVYTALMTTVDALLGGAFSKAVGKGADNAVKQEVANVIKGYTAGDISAEAAKSRIRTAILDKGLNAAGSLVKHNLQGAGMMAAPQAVDLALQEAFGDHPPNFKESVDNIVKSFQTGFWASTPLSIIPALAGSGSRFSARMMAEQAGHPEFRNEMVKNNATPEQLKNFDLAQKILTEIRNTDVAPKDIPQLLMHEVNQAILKEKISETASPSLKERLKQQAEISKQKAQTILDRQGVDLRPQDKGNLALPPYQEIKAKDNAEPTRPEKEAALVQSTGAKENNLGSEDYSSIGGRSIKSEEPPLPEGRTPVTLSGHTEEERQSLIEQRKKETAPKENTEAINSLLDKAKAYNDLPNGSKGKTKSAGLQMLNDIRSKAADLGLKFDDRAGKLRDKSGKIVRPTYSDKAIDEKGLALHQRDEKTGQVLQQLLDEDVLPDFYDEKGQRMSGSRIDGAIKDIQDGVPSIRANRVLDQLEGYIGKDKYQISDGVNKAEVGLNDLLQTSREVVGEKDTPPHVIDQWLKGEAEISPELEQHLYDNVDNLEALHGEDNNEIDFKKRREEIEDEWKKELSKVEPTRSKEEVLPSLKDLLTPGNKIKIDGVEHTVEDYNNGKAISVGNLLIYKDWLNDERANQYDYLRYQNASTKEVVKIDSQKVKQINDVYETKLAQLEKERNETASKSAEAKTGKGVEQPDTGRENASPEKPEGSHEVKETGAGASTEKIASEGNKKEKQPAKDLSQAEAIHQAKKPDVKMTFLSAKELAGVKGDEVAAYHQHKEIREEYRKLKQLIDCLWKM